jgi:hypothetical protein
MDETRFDRLIRSLTESRRSLLGVALGIAAGAWLAPEADAEKKKRRKRRKKKQRPVFNQFGCVNVGGACFGNNANCCSGICEGTGAESRCLAHNALACAVSNDTCQEFTPCGKDGSCYRTTGNAGFCGNQGLCDCGPCARDTDCEAKFGPGAACIVCNTNEISCVGVKGSQGTACVPPAPVA